MEEENVLRFQRTELSIAWLFALFMTVRGETSEKASRRVHPALRNPRTSFWRMDPPSRIRLVFWNILFLIHRVIVFERRFAN
jgi:hypothetical protein